MLSEYGIHLMHSSKAPFSGCSELDSRIVLVEYFSKLMHFLHCRGMAFLNPRLFIRTENLTFIILSIVNLNKYFE